MAKQGPGRRHTLLEKIRRGAILDRRGMTLVFGTALVIVMISAAVIIRSLLPVKLTEPDRAMLKQYDSIRVALSHDDLALAKKAAATLAGSYQKRRPISAAAQAL